MTIITNDYKRCVNIGRTDIWRSLHATIFVNLRKKLKSVPMAIQFLESGSCSCESAMETARQFNLIRDMLSQYPPEKLVYDQNHPKGPAPWDHNISPVVTSCANFYTTADGGDLLYEIVSILCYAGIVGVSVSVQ